MSLGFPGFDFNVAGDGITCPSLQNESHLTAGKPNLVFVFLLFPREMVNKQTCSHRYTSQGNSYVLQFVLSEGVRFFSVCVLEASVSQHTETSFFQGSISPPSAQFSLLCSLRQTHPFLSLTFPNFCAVGACLPLILSSLPMSSCPDAQLRAGVSSWALDRAPWPPAAPVQPLP